MQARRARAGHGAPLALIMSRELEISVGQHSDKGRKPENQDFHGALFPKEPLLGLKGVAVLLADGISSTFAWMPASAMARFFGL